MKVGRILFIILGIMVLVLAPNIIHTKANSNLQIFLNEEQIHFQEHLFVENGRTYVPVRFVGEHLGAAVEWNNKDRTITVKTQISDVIIFHLDSEIISLNDTNYTMDVIPLNRYERVYLPIRHISELLHVKIKWDEHKIHLKSVPLYEVQAGDSLKSISENFNTTVELIKKRNSLQSDIVTIGTKLKTIIPVVMDNQEDTELLAKIIEAESGSEPFIGQIAIGNVIVNRVRDQRFPNSVEGVIKQEGQFTPVITGVFSSIIPSETARNAAEKALQGEKPAGEALYFFNPASTTNPFLLGREVIIDIGNHRFTK
ncbi:cell wall hydrolase [Calidifontibacillus oryziterrae]|uniref:cell wall hydrolase n=1 Tax=Calidifontibacillus oryziterrae TaxID=1191699 RepID=UPI0002EE781E|nr:cell wall hydrolase [Calidifontibacillus oryziterrae]